MTAAASPVISDEEIVSELRAAWAEVSRGYARCWAAMVEVARRTTTGWETAEIAAALTFTPRRADHELSCAQTLLERLPRVYAALASGELDHHKARVFTDYLREVTAAQAERICARLVPVAPGWTTGQLAARLLREVKAIDPDHTRRSYEQALRERAVHGYLDHTGTAVLSGSGLPAGEAAAAAARLETLADQLRAAGYPATINQTRADLYLRLLDGTLDGLTAPQIQTTMLRLGPLAPADPNPAANADPGPHTDPDPATDPDLNAHAHTDTDTDTQPRPHPGASQPDHQPTQDPAPEQPAPTEQPAPAEGPAQPPPAEQPAPAEGREALGCGQRPGPGTPTGTGTQRLVRLGVEIRVRLSTLLGLDDHPAELPGWGPIPATAAREMVAAQHAAEWRIAVVDAEGFLLHGEVKRFSYTIV